MTIRGEARAVARRPPSDPLPSPALGDGRANRFTPTCAHVAHAAAALYLGLRSRELDVALEAGASLAELAAYQPERVDGLKHAVLRAFARMGDPSRDDYAALVDRVVDRRESLDILGVPVTTLNARPCHEPPRRGATARAWAANPSRSASRTW